MNTPRRGFTLVEMAIVLVIVGLLATTLLPGLISAIKRGHVSETRNAMTATRNAVIGYALHKKLTQNPVLPASLDDLGNPLDSWGNPLRYWCDNNLNASNSTADICTGALSPANKKVFTAQGESITHVAFVLQSGGPDAQNGTLANASTIHDDIVVYVTLPQLRAQVCAP